jgi:mannose-6-phosphate isomerase
VDDGVERTVLCAGPYSALERWTAGGWTGRLDRARSLLFPAALGDLRIQGPADVLIGYVPDLERDVRAPLSVGGHGPTAAAALGEVLGPPNASG